MGKARAEKQNKETRADESSETCLAKLFAYGSISLASLILLLDGWAAEGVFQPALRPQRAGGLVMPTAGRARSHITKYVYNV